MKKYIIMMLVVLTAGFTSCSNDDIPVEQDVTYKTFETTFTIDPSGVIEPFRFESYQGHLSKVPDGAQLRLRLLIYDSNGEIVDLLTNKQSNYQSTWSVKTELQAGSYTALVVSDVINTNNPDVQEYWTLKDYNKINDVKLMKNLDWLGYQKEILGVGHLQFGVQGSNSTVSLDLRPAGAACYFYSENEGDYPITFWNMTNMEFKSVFWDSSYNLKVEKEISDSYKYALGGIELSVGTYAMSFVYLLPSQNQYFAYYCETEDDFFRAGDEMCISDIKAGEQYFFMCFYLSGYNGYQVVNGYDNVTGSTFDEWLSGDSRGRSVEIAKVYNNHEMYESVFMKKMRNAVLIKDLIK